MPIQHLHAACPFSIFMLHVLAACPCCMSMLHAHADCQCCMSLHQLFLLQVSETKTRNWKRNEEKRSKITLVTLRFEVKWKIGNKMKQKIGSFCTVFQLD
jgi:hypothetical protein